MFFLPRFLPSEQFQSLTNTRFLSNGTPPRLLNINAFYHDFYNYVKTPITIPAHLKNKTTPPPRPPLPSKRKKLPAKLQFRKEKEKQSSTAPQKETSALISAHAVYALSVIARARGGGRLKICLITHLVHAGAHRDRVALCPPCPFVREFQLYGVAAQ